MGGSDCSRLSRTGRSLALAGLLGLAAAGSGGQAPAMAAGEVFVNTTEDLPYSSDQCLPQMPCSLRAAVGRMEGRQGTIRACYDPAEVGGTKKCPPGWQPLRFSDPGYDAERQQWVFQIGQGMPPFEMASSGNTLDFTKDVDGWASPADNRVVLDSGPNPELKQFLSLIVGHDNRFMGFDVGGRYLLAGIDVFDGATNNQFGPGLNFVGITSGAGIRIYGPETTGNRLVGSWCGLTGDGTQLRTVSDDCVQILDGAHDNVIGGPDAADRNVLGGSSLGVAISIGEASYGNVIEGNWLGLNGQGGAAAANLGGITVAQESHGTRIVGNVISGNKGPGVSVADGTQNTVIENNRIGTDASGAAPVPNRTYGVRIVGAPKAAMVQHNRIAFNESGGVYISGGAAYDHTVTENSITDNEGHGIEVLQGANRNIKPPRITYVTPTLVRGTACKGCLVEVFSDPANEADVFEGAVTAGDDGLFTFEKAEGFHYRNLTATATNGRNTSALSEMFVVPSPGTETPTPSAGTPTPTSTRDPGGLTTICLPWLERHVGAP